MSRHFFLEQHRKLLSMQRNHQRFHLDLAIGHSCHLQQCLRLQLIMHKNLMQKNLTVVSTNVCFFNHFSNFCKILEDFLVHYSTFLKNVLKFDVEERNSLIPSTP